MPEKLEHYIEGQIENVFVNHSSRDDQGIDLD